VRVEVAEEFALRVRRDEPMSRHTSWHVGGPVDVFFNPRDRKDLAAFLRSLTPEVPIHWVGLGSNLLIRDGGLEGVVISTHGTLDRFDRLNQTNVYGEAGLACARIAKQCVKWGLGPAEFFAGIPGTLGGALAMNAGAFGGETWRHVVEVQTIDRRMELRLGLYQPAGRSRRAAHRHGGSEGISHRRCVGVREARELHYQSRECDGG
jgi:UDP-N-acetylmuramate dehydrogenase